MSRSKKLYALLGVLIVACVATFALTQMEDRKEQIKTSGETVLSIDEAAVTTLSWEYADTALAFHRDEEQVWRYDDDEAFPVDQDKISELLENFQAFGAAFTIEEVEDFGQYGLDDPECTIQLTAGEQTYEIKLGDFSAMDSQRYVSIGDGNVYLAAVDPLDTFNVTFRGMIQHDDTFGYDQIHTIQFDGAESYTITWQEDSAATYCADDRYFTQRDGKTVPLDTSQVEDYLSEMITLSLTNYVTYNATEEELKTCGMDSPELTITVNYTDEDADSADDENTFVLHISRDPEEVRAAEEAEDDEEVEVTAYARVGDSPIIYEIGSTSYEMLAAASYNDLRHLNIFTGDFEDVTQLDITLEGNTHILTADGEGEDRKWFYQEKEVDISELQSALEYLRSPSAISFTDETPTGKEEISVTLHLNNENFPQVEIQLYRYDGSDCLAVVDGATVARVYRSEVVDIIEETNAIVLGESE